MKIAEQIAAQEARLKALIAKKQEKLAKLRERQLRMAADYVKKAGAAGLEPELLMGLLLRAVEAAQDETVADECRRVGREHFAATARKRAKRETAKVEVPTLTPRADAA